MILNDESGLIDQIEILTPQHFQFRQITLKLQYSIEMKMFTLGACQVAFWGKAVETVISIREPAKYAL
jgi:hypothetical protein